jgi:hypothetical protein
VIIAAVVGLGMDIIMKIESVVTCMNTKIKTSRTRGVDHYPYNFPPSFPIVYLAKTQLVLNVDGYMFCETQYMHRLK